MKMQENVVDGDDTKNNGRLGCVAIWWLGAWNLYGVPIKMQATSSLWPSLWLEGRRPPEV